MIVKTTTLDLSSFGTLTGTFRIIISATGGTAAASPTNTSFQQTFVDGDLSSGILTVTHNLSSQYVQVIVYDNTDQIAVPDDITATSANVSTLDFTSFGALTGTFRVVILSAGSSGQFDRSFRQAFVNADLTAGVLSVAHNLGQQFVQVQVFNNSDELINPDDVTLTDSDNLTVDLSGFGAITGTFNVVVISSGSAASSIATDLNLTGQAAEDTPFFDGTNWVAKGGTEKIKVDTFSRDVSIATGTQIISGVGFKPSDVSFIAVVGVSRRASWGYDDGTTAKSIYDNWTGANFNFSSAQSIVILTDPSNHYQGIIQSFDADGFTISWVRTGTPTGTANIHFTAIR